MIAIKFNAWNVKNARSNVAIDINIQEIINQNISVEKLFEVSKGLNAQRYLIQFKKDQFFIDIISSKLDSILFRLNAEHSLASSISFSETFISFHQNNVRYYLNQNDSSLVITNMSEEMLINNAKESPLLFFILKSVDFFSDKNANYDYRFAQFFRSYTNMSDDYLPNSHSPSVSALNEYFFNSSKSINEKDAFGVLRQSTRETKNDLNSEKLYQMLRYFFSKSERKYYPSAGNLYEIFPIITLTKDLDSLKAGTYLIKDNQLTLEPGLLADDSIHQEKMQKPVAIITLISDFSKIYNRYHNKALRLTIQNSGVLMSSIHHYLCQKEIGSCIYGLDLFSTKLMKESHFEMGSIYIY